MASQSLYLPSIVDIQAGLGGMGVLAPICGKNRLKKSVSGQNVVVQL